jgi:predicted nucleotidyltransferase
MDNGLLNTAGLTERSFRELQGLLSRYPDIEEVVLFGSRAKGTFHSGSDVDLAIMNTGLHPETIPQLLDAISESSIPYQVDVVDFHSLRNPDLLDHILRVGLPFFRASETQ